MPYDPNDDSPDFCVCCGSVDCEDDCGRDLSTFAALEAELEYPDEECEPRLPCRRAS